MIFIYLPFIVLKNDLISSRKSETKINRMGFNTTVKPTSILKSFVTTWTNFWERTSISGLSNASGSKSRYRTYLWVLIFAIFTVLTIVGLDEVFKDYSAFPVTTSVTVKHNNQVYIYNFDRLSKMNKREKYANILFLGNTQNYIIC